MIVHGYSEATIRLANKPVGSAYSKHIDVVSVDSG